MKGPSITTRPNILRKTVHEATMPKGCSYSIYSCIENMQHPNSFTEREARDEEKVKLVHWCLVRAENVIIKLNITNS